MLARAATWTRSISSARPIQTRSRGGGGLLEAPWYQSWLREQMDDNTVGASCIVSRSSTAHENVKDSLISICGKVQDLVIGSNCKTIDEIVLRLVDVGDLDVNSGYNSRAAVTQLVFSVLGWLTMLYRSAPSSDEDREFCIKDETGGHLSLAHLCHRQPLKSSRYEFPRLFLGFGMMFPPQDYCSFHESEDIKLFNQIKLISAESLNAHVLVDVCNVKIRWTDTLSCHLELDTKSGILYLFRYPSFCVHSLGVNDALDHASSVLHCSGSERPGLITWASRQDVTELLQEILLSYRLLFGQDRKSRRLFRKQQPFARSSSAESRDPLLAELCARRQIQHCPVQLVEREEYNLVGDFLI